MIVCRDRERQYLLPPLRGNLITFAPHAKLSGLQSCNFILTTDARALTPRQDDLGNFLIICSHTNSVMSSLIKSPAGLIILTLPDT